MQDDSLVQHMVGCVKKRNVELSRTNAEEFTLGIDSKSLHAMVLMQMVYNAVIRHSGGFLKHMVISVVKKVKITAV